MDHVIGGKFKLGRKIGSGSFGELYLGMQVQGLFSSIQSVLTTLSSVCLQLGFCYFSLCLLAGINVQSGEEVAVKLVGVTFLEIICYLVLQIVVS